MGVYVSKERVIRNGYLIAYEGEEMTEDEAMARGLITPEKPAATRKRATKRAVAKKADGEEGK